MTATVSGIYKEGKIELLDIPQGVPEGRVRVVVTVEQETPKPEPRYLEFGKYPGDTPLEAFKEGEWHGEPEFDDLYGP